MQRPPIGSFVEEDAMTADVAIACADTDAPAADSLAEELKALRDKAERIGAELATLYQRMDELQEQIRLHQER